MATKNPWADLDLALERAEKNSILPASQVPKPVAQTGTPYTPGETQGSLQYPTPSYPTPSMASVSPAVKPQSGSDLISNALKQVNSITQSLQPQVNSIIQSSQPQNPVVQNPVVNMQENPNALADLRSPQLQAQQAYIPTTADLSGIETNPYLKIRDQQLGVSRSSAESRRAAAVQEARNRAAAAGAQPGTAEYERIMQNVTAVSNTDFRETMNQAALEGVRLREKDYLERSAQATKAIQDLEARSDGTEGLEILAKIRAQNPQANEITLAQLFYEAVDRNPELFRALTESEKADRAFAKDAEYRMQNPMTLNYIIQTMNEDGKQYVDQEEFRRAVALAQNGDYSLLAKQWAYVNSALATREQLSEQERATQETKAREMVQDIIAGKKDVQNLSAQELKDLWANAGEFQGALVSNIPNLDSTLSNPGVNPEKVYSLKGASNLAEELLSNKGVSVKGSQSKEGLGTEFTLDKPTTVMIGGVPVKVTGYKITYSHPGGFWSGFREGNYTAYLTYEDPHTGTVQTDFWYKVTSK